VKQVASGGFANLSRVLLLYDSGENDDYSYKLKQLQF
jgi:hypothetical protein